MSSPRPSEQGFTLVELLVVMLIAGVVGAVVTTALVRGMQTSTMAQSRINGLSDLQRGLERVARELRVADPLCVPVDAGDPDIHESRLGASVYRDGKRYYHEFYLAGSGENQSLLQDVTVYDPPDASTGTLLSSGTFVAETGNDLLGIPLFEYFDQNGDTPTPVGAAAQVTINLSKQVLDDDPVRVTTTVEVRNTRYSSGGGPCS